MNEALELARGELGDDAVVRCWKVRRGGLFGFFARETFIAGVERPGDDGANTESPGPRGARPTGQRASTSPLAGAWRRAAARERRGPVTATRPELNDLVEATTDELMLSASLSDQGEFATLLAEAEAALTSGSLTRGEYDPPSGERAGSARTRVEGLRASVAALGVPAAYQPDEDESLDSLVRSLAALPAAAPMDVVEGAIIVVVGSRRDALGAARHVLAVHALDEGVLFVGERTAQTRQRVLRRRSSARATVLVLEVPVGSRELDQAAEWIDRLGPDYVLGAVSATVKRADLERWCERLRRVDALALSRLGYTSTPGELMGAAPIVMVDGEPASALRWLVLLIGRTLERER
ncbi:MAG TPA: hypothetical protein VMV53_01240 [Acidimicrobiales bacterium]|nr:hypothetical protein [Acidimicrobiales bacterium]